MMVTPGRFELPTCGLGNRRSIHLSYGATQLQGYHPATSLDHTPTLPAHPIPIPFYRHRKIQTEIANGTTTHASKIATGAISFPKLVPCSMFPLIASIAAVSGSARTIG